MKKTKIIVSVFTFCVAILALCFGVYAAINVNYSAAGTVHYEVTNAKVEVTTTLYKTNLKVASAQALKTEADQYAAKTTSGWTKVGTPVVHNTGTNPQTEVEADGLKVDYVEQKEECFFVVINVKNLEADGGLNAFARITKEVLGANINSHVYVSAGHSVIAPQATATIVIAFGLDDRNTPINNVTFDYYIELGAGVMPTELENLGGYWGIKMGTYGENKLVNWRLVSVDNGVSPYTFNADVVPTGLCVFVLETTDAGLATKASIAEAYTYMNGDMMTTLNISNAMKERIVNKTNHYQDTFKVDGNDISYTKGAAAAGQFYLLSEREALNLLGNQQPTDAYTYNNGNVEGSRTGLVWNSTAYMLRTTNKQIAANGTSVDFATPALRPAFTLGV